MRLDQYLAINHYFESRNQAAAAIKKGYFAVNGKVTTRPSCEVPEGAQVVQVKTLRNMLRVPHISCCMDLPALSRIGREKLLQISELPPVDFARFCWSTGLGKYMR